MNPASVMKLVTTTVALELLGPAYTWRTEVHLAGKLQNERLDGDLILRGGGDPHLTMESLWMLLRDVRARGVREITGDLVLDRSLFATGPFDPAAFDGEPARPYNVGSEEDMAIADVAARVASAFGVSTTVARQAVAGAARLSYLCSTIGSSRSVAPRT